MAATSPSRSRGVLQGQGAGGCVAGLDRSATRTVAAGRNASIRPIVSDGVRHRSRRTEERSREHRQHTGRAAEVGMPKPQINASMGRAGDRPRVGSPTWASSIGPAARRRPRRFPCSCLPPLFLCRHVTGRGSAGLGEAIPAPQLMWPPTSAWRYPGSTEPRN